MTLPALNVQGGNYSNTTEKWKTPPLERKKQSHKIMLQKTSSLGRNEYIIYQYYKMIMTMQFLVNNRPYSTFSPLASELTFDLDKNYLFDLSYLGVIDVAGEKGHEFLQGQLSCDLREVTPKTMRQGAMCNLKGRVLALVDVLDWQGLHLILPNDLLTETQTSLAKTAMFSRVKLTDSQSCQLFGFYLQNSKDLIPFNRQLPQEHLSVVYESQHSCYSLGNGFYVYMIRDEAESTITTPFKQHQQFKGSLAWHERQLQQLNIQIYPESRGLLLPHRLGLQKSGHISFNKGCYKGQEIIARTHYRAKLKHEMKLLTMPASEPVFSGKALFSNDSAVEIGEIIDYCPISDEQLLVAASVKQPEL